MHCFPGIFVIKFVLQARHVVYLWRCTTAQLYGVPVAMVARIWGCFVLVLLKRNLSSYKKIIWCTKVEAEYSFSHDTSIKCLIWESKFGGDILILWKIKKTLCFFHSIHFPSWETQGSGQDFWDQSDSSLVTQQIGCWKLGNYCKTYLWYSG